MAKNPLLKYSVEVLLVEANPAGEPFFRKTHLYKTLFLLHQNLLGQGIDIGLPYCWYLHGPLIEAITFEEQTGTPLDGGYLQPDGATVPLRHVHDEELMTGEKQVVLQEIRKILRKYRSGTRWEEGYGSRLVGDAYKLAPFRYQRTFKREYLDYLVSLSGEPRVYDYAYGRISSNILRYLDTLIKQFPENEMSELLDTYLAWDDTARLFVETRDPLDALSNRYWEIFCSLLRVRKNENVPEEIVERWERSFAQELPLYDREFETTHDEALGRLEQDTQSRDIDPIVLRLMAYARDECVRARPREM
ncbi:hypothetical protein [Methanoculleus sp. 10]|uniref:hypothetical protein n=1 Tax=Methanoculleus sp. 10 TaxID=430615 RepID=UPI0025D7ED95|nr:hypothetical protein [Methanoculleus sp. 10]MCK9278594.1 hypothetical protein [Methanoculleus sp.]